MDRVGKFEVVEELGRGAMGVVFRCFDPAIGRPVAIKVIRSQVFATNEENQEARLRFAREAAAVGRLSHPNIVTVFELGREQDNQFLVMELVEGKPLDQVPHENCLAILRQLAGALDYAHSNGIIHRDVKPANVLVRADGQVKLTDFGIARISSQTMTQTGMTFGTPAYMAPEQVIASRVDGRADQFSLAVVAFELLTGRKPFAGATSQAVIYAIVQGDRPAAHEINSALPPAVSDVLRRALAKGAADRFPTCSDFVGALETALALQAPRPPISQPPPGPPLAVSDAPAAPHRRFGLAAIVASGFLLTGLLLGAYTLLQHAVLGHAGKEWKAARSEALLHTKPADPSPHPLTTAATSNAPRQASPPVPAAGLTAGSSKVIAADSSKPSPGPLLSSAPVSREPGSVSPVLTPSVAYAFWVKPGIIYLAVRSFESSNMDREVNEQLAGLDEAAASGLILDLRRASGGVVAAAASLAGRFLHNGEAVVSLRGGARPDQVYQARASAAEQNYPIVVLVSSNASFGSAIVTDALQDHDRAWILGERSGLPPLQRAGLGEMRALYAPSGRLIGSAGSAATGPRPTNDFKDTDSGRKVYDDGSVTPDEKFADSSVDSFQRRLQPSAGSPGKIATEIQEQADPQVLHAIDRLPLATRLAARRSKQ